MDLTWVVILPNNQDGEEQNQGWDVTEGRISMLSLTAQLNEEGLRT